MCWLGVGVLGTQCVCLSERDSKDILKSVNILSCSASYISIAHSLRTPSFRYSGGYWEARQEGSFSNCRDIFGVDPTPAE